MDIYPSDARFYIQREYDARQGRNPAYSWRSFARDLKISPSMLSEFLKSRYGFSRTKAMQVAKGLELDEAHTQHFINLLEAQFHRSPDQRRLARLRVDQRCQWTTTSPSHDWRHLSLLHASHLGELSRGWMIEIPVDQLVQDLKALSLLQADGQAGLDLPLSRTQNVPSNAFHQPEEISLVMRLNSTQRLSFWREVQDALLQIASRHSGCPGADGVDVVQLRLGRVYQRP